MITLASDFGTPYPAAMKGVILDRTDARLVDIAHDFPRQDVRAAAFWLRETLPYFPPAVHLVVVDPGVGTDRRAIVLRAGEHALVGPDNGVLVPPTRVIASDQDGDGSAAERIDAFEIRVDDPASSTFHGRDVFAPAAADVHESGVERLDDVSRFEPVPTDSLVDLRFPKPTVEGDVIRGEILVVDDFGNAITNVPGDLVSDVPSIVVNGIEVPVVQTFASVGHGERLVTVGSHGYVECDVNRGRGDEAFGLEAGDTLTIERSSG